MKKEEIWNKIKEACVVGLASYGACCLTSNLLGINRLRLQNQYLQGGVDMASTMSNISSQTNISNPQ